jgi:hypothetical protein
MTTLGILKRNPVSSGTPHVPHTFDAHVAKGLNSARSEERSKGFSI